MLKENEAGYASTGQREVLLGLCEEPRIESDFFLTGGTALAVFFLGHRVSEDLELFTVQDPETAGIPDLVFWITRRWPGRSSAGRRGPGFAAVDIQGVKVDLVSDPLSETMPRRRFTFETGRSLAVDSIANIASNKLAAIVSRVEAKDFVDLYFIRRAFPDLEWTDLLAAARRKEALFDDPPSAAFQIEEGFRMAARGRPAREQRLLRPLDEREFTRFYQDVAERLYAET
jgi:hypothetical protein